MRKAALGYGSRVRAARSCLAAPISHQLPLLSSPPLILQVWACKSYTRTVPLFVQTLRQATVRQVAPFLDPGQDVIVSMVRATIN